MPNTINHTNVSIRKPIGVKVKLSRYLRARRDKVLRDLIAKCPRRGETLEILDLGGRVDYWQRVGLDFLTAHKVRVTLVNLNDFEIGDSGEAEGMFLTAIGDARALDFADNAFDLCHSNSVIEHVGLWGDMIRFAQEMRRVAPSYYCQSPNFWFPIDPHFPLVPFNHWLPRPLRVRLMRWLPIAHSGRADDLSQAASIVDSARMITGWQMKLLFPDARMQAERIATLAKSYTAVRLAAG